MLYFQRDWSRGFAGEGDPVDSTHQLGVVWEVVVPTEAGLDGDGGGRRERLQGISWHSQPQTMALPLISFPCSQCHCGCGHNVSSSDGGWRGRQGEGEEEGWYVSLTIQSQKILFIIIII